jgi:dihydroxyacetone kinase DhaKLM complex PTS-EIIA-like component DhaM
MVNRRYMVIIPVDTNESLKLAKYTGSEKHAEAIGADICCVVRALKPLEEYEDVFIVDDLGVCKGLPNNTRAQEILVRMGVYARESVPTIAGTMILADVGSASQVRAYWRKFNSFLTK